MATHSIPTIICEGGTDNAHCSDGTGYADILNMQLQHNTSNANYGVISCNIRMAFSGDAVPFSTRHIGWWGMCIDALGSHEIGQRIWLMTYGSPFSFDSTWYGEGFNITSSTTQITYRGYFTFNKGVSDWMYIAFDETLPNTLKITSPQGLSGSFPSSITGNVSGSITAWGLGSPTPMKGTPTTYTNAKVWNWSAELLDESGNVVARKLYNTGETKSCSFGTGDSGWYTANALDGSASAVSTPYEVQAGKKYRIRLTVSNDYNRTASTTSGWYYAAPPEPTVSITSIVYNPTTKKSELCFDWSLAKSGLTPETLTYEATLPDGTVVASGTVKTITDGSADSGSVCNVSVPTGDSVTLTVTNTAGSGTDTMTSTGSDSVFSPVANAAFLGFDWDELRRTCTIRAEAPGAANCRIEAGYAANSFTIGDKLTTGEIGELVVSELNHGNGEILYLQATPESSNGHKYMDEIAQISIPIPNPIIGIKRYPCDSGKEDEYIVDIIEHKTDGTCTPRWQTGDRVVVKERCADNTPEFPAGSIVAPPIDPSSGSGLAPSFADLMAAQSSIGATSKFTYNYQVEEIALQGCSISPDKLVPGEVFATCNNCAASIKMMVVSFERSPALVGLPIQVDNSDPYSNYIYTMLDGEMGNRVLVTRKDNPPSPLYAYPNFTLLEEDGINDSGLYGYVDFPTHTNSGNSDIPVGTVAVSVLGKRGSNDNTGLTYLPGAYNRYKYTGLTVIS